MGPRNHDAERPPREIGKEMPQLRAFIVCQDGEAGQRAADATVKRRRDSPHATFSSAQFLLFRCSVFLETVRGIGDNRVNRVCRVLVHPGKTVGQVQGIPNPVEAEVRLLMAPSCGRTHLCIKYHERRWICTIVWSSRSPTKPAGGFESV